MKIRNEWTGTCLWIFVGAIVLCILYLGSVRFRFYYTVKPLSKKAQREIPEDPNAYRTWFLSKTKEEPFLQWKMPIDFWGQVVDEESRPIEGATINFHWNELTGTSRSRAKSDKGGRFSITNAFGKVLGVDVHCDGYYPFPGSSRRAYEFATPGERFRGNPAAPEVFRFKKASPLPELNALEVRIPIISDSQPVGYDFINQKKSRNGQIQFRIHVEPRREHQRQFNWRLWIEIPEGGFRLITNDFPFLAPTNGYFHQLLFDMKLGDSNWTMNASGKYFVKFGTPPLYGRIQFAAHARPTDVGPDSSVWLKYWVNPSGSRNLEADPGKPLPRFPPERKPVNGVYE